MRFQHLALAVALTAAITFTPLRARAEAVVRVQQSDGTVQVYRHVQVTLSGATLWLRSSDRADRLQIVSGACSFPRNLLRCLPYKVFLHKPGRTHPIAITHGVFYVNSTDQAHRLLHSSQLLAPHGILVFLHTVHGTYVSATGSLDATK